jgi:hypothetical protein
MLLPLLLNNLLAQQPPEPQPASGGGRARRSVHWIPLSPQPGPSNPDAPIRRRRRDDELIALFKP